MDLTEFHANLFGSLEARFRELGFETSRAADAPAGSVQVSDSLMFLLPVTEDDDRVLADLRFVKISDNRYCVQIFLTIFTDLEEGYMELEKAVPVLNYRTMLGCYGMFPEMRQFWHKYSMVIREFDMIDGAEGFAVALLDDLDLIREQVTGVFEPIKALASGGITYKEAVDAGLIVEL